MKNTKENKASSFTSSIGFVLAAAGSAVGLGNIWRFPALAAKDGGGLFIIIYILLALTFGYVLLTTDIAIGRKTGTSALNAYEKISKKWKFLGILSFIVPAIILTYYSVVGGWIIKYMTSYISLNGTELASDGYFAGFISSPVSPIVYMLIFLAATSLIVYMGVEKGIEKFSKVIMPALIIMIVGISIFTMTRTYTDENGTRTGLQGLAVYFIPNFTGLTISRFFEIVLDAMCQLFYSLSVSMGIMITYGSYVKKENNLSKSVTQIEIFDTIVAILAGLMVVNSVYVFSGIEAVGEGGAGLMFIALPKIFNAMGFVGKIIGPVFFVMVTFAALTSSVSIMETIVADCINKFNISRKKASLTLTVVFTVASLVICAGYNVFYFELSLPNGSTGQLLDLFDYISNYLMMPLISIFTCILIGWIKKPEWIIEEMEFSGQKFSRKGVYKVIIKYFAPVMMTILFLKAIGLF